MPKGDQRKGKVRPADKFDDVEVTGAAADLGRALHPNHRRLADMYLRMNMNKRAAARECGYSIDKSGSGANRYYMIFRREDVREYIAARLAEEVMGANEVLARLSERARLDGSDFFIEEEYEVAVYEARPLREKINLLEAKVGQLNRIDPGLLKAQIEKTQAEIADLEVKLALDPDATWDKQVGTETRKRTRHSLEAARANGVLQFVEGAEEGPNGLKFKWADPVKALELIGKHHKLFTDRTEHAGSIEHGVKYIAGLNEGDL